MGRGGVFYLEEARFLVCGCDLPTGCLLSPALSSRDGKRGGGGARARPCGGRRSGGQGLLIPPRVERVGVPEVGRVARCDNQTMANGHGINQTIPKGLRLAFHFR